MAFGEGQGRLGGLRVSSYALSKLGYLLLFLWVYYVAIVVLDIVWSIFYNPWVLLFVPVDFVCACVLLTVWRHFR